MDKAAMEAKLRDAIDAHAKWKIRLKTAMATRHSDISVEHAACDDRCEFGKWLVGPMISDEVRDGAPYQVIRKLHAEFHQAASVALEGALFGGKRKRDSLALEAFDDRSAKLNQALQKWLGEIRAG